MFPFLGKKVTLTIARKSIVCTQSLLLYAGSKSGHPEGHETFFFSFLFMVSIFAG
jgi:hypothetical protein